jgi:predicted DNA-binding transcriptional regulator YafY
VRLDPGSVLMTVKLTVPEVFALLIGVAATRAAGTLPFAGLADAGLAKIERALPREGVADLRRVLDRLHVDRLSPEQDASDVGPIDADLLPAFEAAVLERRRLRFDHTDAAGLRTHREVEPQAMLVLPPPWHLVA